MSANARVIKNAVVYWDSYDLSGDENEITLSGGIDAKEATVMGDTNRLYKPGLNNMELVLAGYTSFGAACLDEEAWMNRGLSAVPLSVWPVGVTPGDRAWLLRTANLGFEQKITVGEMPTFKATFKSSDSPVVGGLVLDRASIDSLPYVGEAYEAGAIGALQSGYGIVHFLGITGSGTLTVKIRSCATVDGTYVDRITFAGKTAVGSEWNTVAGAVTDTFWKVEASQSGGITACELAVSFGIQ